MWATALTTSSFMAGLAIGSALAAVYGERVRRPLRLFAFLELVVGGSGFALVLILPSLADLLVPVFRGFLESAPALNAARLFFAFAALSVPASAMGATLPLLTRAMSLRDPGFGRALGRLYGWNTLGAMAGVVLAEGLLIGQLGLRGTGLVAAATNATVAAVALALSGRFVAPGAPPGERGRGRLPARGKRLLAAAFLCGAILLALEVVWFRFLILFIDATNLVFAVLLGVVLFGIGLGGLTAAVWLRWRPGAVGYLPALALAGGVACVLAYATFGSTLERHSAGPVLSGVAVASVGARLMLPVCLLSGVLFTLLGAALKEHVAQETRTAGYLTVANTVGAAVGALAGGFLLLPGLGVERSFALTAALYGGVGLLVLGPAKRTLSLAAAACFALALAFFPFGLMATSYVPRSVGRWMGDGSRPVAVREGLTETIVYLRKDFLEEPLYHRLVTNSISMAGSGFASQRYMRLFAWWPLALHPEPRDALLISYGVGSTARALADAPLLRAIDVVDISADVLELGRIVFPLDNPLDDPRVRVHVEDGRFFLNTTRRTYDIITSEPPPPKSAGVVNLYTREYFGLLKRRLNRGGFVTYWLPVYQLGPAEFRALVRAFCDVFEDCSLWTAFGPEWMLAGSRGSAGGTTEGRFREQWADPRAGPALRALGLEFPEQLGTLFIGDAGDLAELVRSAEPLEDNYPYRLSPDPSRGHPDFYSSIGATHLGRRRFRESAFIRAHWPADLRRRTVAFFDEQVMLNRFAWSRYGAGEVGVGEAHHLLTHSPLRTGVSWVLGSSVGEQAIARRAEEAGRAEAAIDEHLGIEALAERRYGEARGRFERAMQRGGDPDRLEGLRALAVRLAEQRGDRAGDLPR